MTKLIRNLLVAALAIGASVAALAQSDKPAAVDPAEWAPAEAFVYFGVSDVDQVWSGWQKTNAYAMLQDPRFKDHGSGNLIHTVMDKFQERLAKALGVEAKQLKNPFKGPVAFYLAAPRGGSVKDIQPGLIASVGDAAVMKKYYDNAIAKLKEASDKHETVTAGSNAIEVFTRDPNSPPKEDAEESDDDEAEGNEDDLDSSSNPVVAMVEEQVDDLFSAQSLPPSLAVCLTADRLLVGASADQVKDMLRREKRGDVLADSDDYKSLAKVLKPVGPVRFLVNVPRITELVKPEGDDLAEYEKGIKTFGVDVMRSLVGTIQIGGENFETRLDAVLLMKGERSGIAKLLSMDNRPIAPAADVSASVFWYAGINLTPSKLIDDIERIVRANDPAAADEMRKQMEAVPLGTSEETVNLRKDFIDHLKAPLTVQLAFARPIGADSLRGMLAIGQKSRDAMNSLLAKFSAFLKPRDVRGTQVYESALGFAVSATSDQLMLGMPAAIEAAVEAKGGNPLADTAAWKAAAKVAPEQAWMVMFSNDQLGMESMIELARNKDSAAAGPSAMFNQALMEMYGITDDEKSLDQAKALLKYVGVSIATVSTTEEGVRFTLAGLKAAK